MNATTIRSNSKELKNAIATATRITKQDNGDMATGQPVESTREDLARYMRVMSGLLSVARYDTYIAVYGSNIIYKVYGN